MDGGEQDDSGERDRNALPVGAQSSSHVPYRLRDDGHCRQLQPMNEPLAHRAAQVGRNDGEGKQEQHRGERKTAPGGECA